MHALHIALHRIGAAGVGAVEPGPDLHIPACRDIGGKAGRDLDRQRQLARAHSCVDLVVTCQGRLFDEIARSRNIGDIIAAGGGLVAVKGGEGQILDIHVDAQPHHDHQKKAADQRHGQPDRIALQLQAFQLRIAKQSPQAEAGLLRVMGHPGCGGLGRGLGRSGGGGCRLANRLFKIGDERVFQRGATFGFRDPLGGVRDQHLARMHQADAVAPFRLVHEMGRDEDGHAVALDD